MEPSDCQENENSPEQESIVRKRIKKSYSESISHKPNDTNRDEYEQNQKLNDKESSDSSEEQEFIDNNDKKDNSSAFKQLLAYINSCQKLNVISVLVSIIAISTIIAIGVHECQRCFADNKDIKSFMNIKCNGTISNFDSSTNPRSYWIYLRKKDDSHLKHVYRVLNSMGYVDLNVNDINNGNNQQDWDLLWAHDYPFIKEYSKLRNLKPYQKVNHLPGCGYITTKVELSTSKLKYILPAFKLPDDKEALLDFAGKQPKKKFVLKDNEHRHIQVKSINEIELDRNGSFVQEFLDDPLLISGHMFDIGIYTIITSIDPLRIYIYNGDVLLRFCPQPFKPFDPANLDKYVVGDDYLPIWEVSKIQYWYKKLGYGMRDSLTAYLAEEGRDASMIWTQIEEAIAIAILDKQAKIVDVVKRFKSKRNFFEMMRFDFLVDNKLNVHLLEANMSPNLSSAHFKPNQLLYEQVLFNLFGLVGLADRVVKPLGKRLEDDRAMVTTDKNILVLPNICSSAICRNNCADLDCKLCKLCLDQNIKFKQDLYDAHGEYLNRGDCKRIFPVPMKQHKKVPAEVMNYTTSNKLMHIWFQEKCNLDMTWC